MKNLGRLIDALNDAIDVQNRIASQVKETNHFYNDRTSEHVFVLEYRVKVAPEKQATGLFQTDQHASLLDAILRS